MWSRRCCYVVGTCLIGILNINVEGSSISASTPSTTTSQKETHYLDLSYQQQLSAGSLATAIVDDIWRSKVRDVVTVDISSSVLGDKGVATIIESLLPSPECDQGHGRGCDKKIIHLSARMNGLTPGDVSSVLDTISGNFSREEGSSTSEEDRNEAEATNAQTRAWYVHSLDLGWNDFHPEATGSKSFILAIRSLIENGETCPRVLRFERCCLGPAVCRAIGKGIMNRYQSINVESGGGDNSCVPRLKVGQPTSLYLCGNEAVGDSGVAALAAALRTVNSCSVVILDVLDLSSCDIGDAGAEAIAMALERRPGCIRHLDLSNNCITDEGVTAIANALLLQQNKEGPATASLESLNLNNNQGVGDRGASDIARLMGSGNLRELSLRSCQVHADGAQAFGQAIQDIVGKTGQTKTVKIDLSGNPFGVLRKKKKKSGQYSASKLKSKASATTASYMNFIGKSIRSGLKDVGLDSVLNNVSPSAESDDDEEAQMGFDDDDDDDDSPSDDKDVDPSKARCGGKSFSSAFFNGKGSDENIAETTTTLKHSQVRCELAMRHCSFDQGAADALAAAVLRAREHLSVDLTIDVRMNAVLEESMVVALAGGWDDGQKSRLEEMADRHLEAMEALRVAEQRAVEAAEAAAARASSNNFGWDDDEDNFELNYDSSDDSDVMFDREYDY